MREKEARVPTIQEEGRYNRRRSALIGQNSYGVTETSPRWISMFFKMKYGRQISELTTNQSTDTLLFFLAALLLAADKPSLAHLTCVVVFL